MPKGVKSLQDDREKNPLGGGGSGKFIQRVLLFNNQDFAEIKFITDFEDMFWEWAHRYQTTVGQANKSIWQVRVCPKQIGQECGRCANNEARSRYFWYWCHVFVIYYDRPGDNRTQVKVGPTLTKFREEVGRPMLLERSFGSHGPVETALNTYGTLVDRPYRWIRQGERGDQKTTYNLIATEGDFDCNEAVAGYIEKLPDLEAVAFGRVEKLDLGDEPEIVKVDTEGVGESSPEVPMEAAPEEVAEEAGLDEAEF